MNIKQKISLISGLFLVVITFLVFGAIKPVVLEIKKVSVDAKENREKLLLLEKTDQSYLRQIETDYGEINNNLNVVKSGLIDNSQAVTFFMNLEETASLTANKLEIKATEFPVLTLDLVGTFPNLMRFLGWLENGKYFLDIQSINISQIIEKEISEGSLPSEDIETTLEIKVYTKK